MILGYARVSTDAQDLTSQVAALKAAGCEKVFRDTLTGAHAERPQLQTLLRTVTQGDVVPSVPMTTRHRPPGSLPLRSFDMVMPRTTAAAILSAGGAEHSPQTQANAGSGGG